MSVILRKRKNKDGSISLLLDIYHEGNRKREFLKHLKLNKPTNSLDRELNKEKIKQAEAIAVARAADLSASDYNLISEIGKKTIVIIWMQSYVDAYTKKDKRNIQGALNRFKSFLQINNQTNITFSQLSPLLIEEFIDYLESKSVGEGASSYYKRFKKMLLYAYKKKLLKENILDFVERNVKGKAIKKEILTVNELKTLATTPIESDKVKRAFFFTTVTGLRRCDLINLRWRDVNLKNKTLVIRQSKTSNDVHIPLNDTAINLLGKEEDQDELIFSLPSYNAVNKTLKAWMKRAKIKKKITFHCARHSFGTNLILAGTEILTASQLLGHTSLKHTQRYVNTAKEMKETATNKLNFDL